MLYCAHDPNIMEGILERKHLAQNWAFWKSGKGIWGTSENDNLTVFEVQFG
jgi:hypothetical protein